MVRVGVSQNAIRRAAAREAVGKHLNVQFTDVTVPAAEGTFGSRNEGVQDSLSGVKEVGNGSPSLIFVYSDEMKPQAKGSKSAGEPTAQAKDSALAWEELFQREGDYTVFIPGRFFNIVKMNATGVPAAKNKYLGSEKAPVVILTHKDGKVEEVFEGKAKIKGVVVAKGMVDILQKDGYITTIGQFAELSGLMVELEKIELAVVIAKEDEGKRRGKVAETQAKTAKRAAKSDKEVKPSKTADAAEKALEASDAALNEKLKGKQEILKKEFALLQELNLPADKMPKEPVGP